MSSLFLQITISVTAANNTLEVAFGDWADQGEEYNLIVGEVIAGGNESTEVNLKVLQETLDRVRVDIPDAEILVFSNLI